MKRSAPALLLASVVAWSVPTFAAEPKDHPAVSAYPESVATRRDEDGFRAYVLVLGVDEAGRSDAEALQTRTVEGDVTRLAYENPKGRSAHEIFTNYREGLEKGGFEILFSCEAKACGPGHATSRWGRVTGLRYFGPQMGYLAARGSKEGREIYVAVLVSEHRHQIEIVEVGAMEKGLVTAEAIGEGLRAEGSVVLDGVYFDTDAATIQPASKPALDAIGTFLAENPGVRVFLVGHTDSTGGFDHNMMLSKARAASVVNALTKGYGIAAERLGAHGVGPLSPRKSNADEGGRAENRRVELVLR